MDRQLYTCNLHVYNLDMPTPVHTRVLDAARRSRGRHQRLAVPPPRDIVQTLPDLDEEDRPHPSQAAVASMRRAITNRVTPISERWVAGSMRSNPDSERTSQRPAGAVGRTALIARVDSGVDRTLIDESLKLTPTERLERMRRAAASLDTMRR